MDYVYFLMILNKKYVATTFLPRHQWGKLDLPKAFICIFFLSSNTKDSSPIFLEAIFSKCIWQQEVRHSGNYFLTTEEPLCEFIKLFSVAIELGSTLRESVNYWEFDRVILSTKVIIWLALKITIAYHTTFVNSYIYNCISTIILLQES